LSRLELLARLADHSALVFEYEDDDERSSGAIVMLRDASGSMSGGRDAWAGGLCGAVIELGRSQGRPVHIIVFSSTREMVEWTFDPHAPRDPMKFLDAISFSFHGGTDFERPLGRAREIVEADYSGRGSMKADIIMLTDGYAHTSEDFNAGWAEFRTRLGVKAFAVDLSGSQRRPPTFDVLFDHTVVLTDLTTPNQASTIFANLGDGR
jgi:uncharacterized protein with von Willebrand factor type A (vWA) domain